MQTHTVATRAVPLAMGEDGSTLLVLAGSGDAHAFGRAARWLGRLRRRNTVDQQHFRRPVSRRRHRRNHRHRRRRQPSSHRTLAVRIRAMDHDADDRRDDIHDLRHDARNRQCECVRDADVRRATIGARRGGVSVDRDTGAIAWRTSIDQPLLESSVAIDSADGSLTFYALYDNKFGTQSIDRTSGALRARRSIRAAACLRARTRRSEVRASRPTARCAMPSESSTRLPIRTYRRMSFGIDSIGTVPPPIPVSQPGIAGVWYAPYESGQGFTIDYIAGSNTLFMPWFTYTQAGGNDPANRNWFSLQGIASAGAASANLTIYTNDGGTFVSGTTSSQPVGTATLAFTDCSHGTLGYHFNSDTNGGASGSISLTRLTAAADDCVLADGSTSPVDATPPGDGFATNQSGSWYDPGTSGQGIEFSITPPADGSSGALFGAWFTYDPSGASDDPRQQNWFTLQGDLSGTVAGEATVGIFSTLGGTLDGTPATTTVPVGQATVDRLHECSSATVDYRFDDSAIAHAYRNLSGSLALTRLGGCTAVTGRPGECRAAACTARNGIERGSRRLPHRQCRNHCVAARAASTHEYAQDTLSSPHCPACEVRHARIATAKPCPDRDRLVRIRCARFRARAREVARHRRRHGGPPRARRRSRLRTRRSSSPAIASWRSVRARRRASRGANEIDGKGKWVIPGMIDAHVHFFQSGNLYTRPDARGFQRVDAVREGSCAQQGAAAGDIQGLARERRHERRRHRRPFWNFDVRDAARTNGRGAARRDGRPADLDGRPSAARPRRSADHQDRHRPRRRASWSRAKSRASPTTSRSGSSIATATISPRRKRSSRRRATPRMRRGVRLAVHATELAGREGGAARRRRLPRALGRGRAGGRRIHRAHERSTRCSTARRCSCSTVISYALSNTWQADGGREAPRRSGDPRDDGRPRKDPEGQ